MSSASVNHVRLGVVCPMANEEASAVAFIDDVIDQCRARNVKAVTFFAVLDLVSKDRTREWLDQHAERQTVLKVIWAPENTCIVDAYVRGYQAALDSGCDWIFEIDAGYSHSPADIPQFFDMMAKGYDCVFGSRFCPGGSMSESPFKRRMISQGGTMADQRAAGHKAVRHDQRAGDVLAQRAAAGAQARADVARPVLSDRDQDLLSSLPHCGSTHRLPGAEPPDPAGRLARFVPDPGRLFRMRWQGKL